MTATLDIKFSCRSVYLLTYGSFYKEVLAKYRDISLSVFSDYLICRQQSLNSAKKYLVVCNDRWEKLLWLKKKANILCIFLRLMLKPESLAALREVGVCVCGGGNISLAQIKIFVSKIVIWTWASPAGNSSCTNCSDGQVLYVQS